MGIQTMSPQIAMQESLNQFMKRKSIAASAAPAPVKFSDDIERLQHINAIRNSLSVGAQIKLAIDLLLEPKYDLKGKDELVSLIKKFPDGIAVVDVKYAYPIIMKDLQALKATDQIWVLTNVDSKEGIAYPNNPKS